MQANNWSWCLTNQAWFGTPLPTVFRCLQATWVAAIVSVLSYKYGSTIGHCFAGAQEWGCTRHEIWVFALGKMSGVLCCALILLHCLVQWLRELVKGNYCFFRSLAECRLTLTTCPEAMTLASTLLCSRRSFVQAVQNLSTTLPSCAVMLTQRRGVCSQPIGALVGLVVANFFRISLARCKWPNTQRNTEGTPVWDSRIDLGCCLFCVSLYVWSFSSQ